MVREGFDEQQLVAVVNQDDNTPIFLRNTPPLNVPRKDDNLVPQRLNPAYRGRSNALIAEQEQSEEVRTTTPWHGRQKEIFLVG
jgi:hypothetical protein